MSRALAFALGLILAASCGGDDDGGGGDADGGGGGPDAGGERDGGVIDPEPCRVALPVDLIWVVDNSNSMQEEQAQLVANFPVLIETLTNPPDRDGDGEPDFPPLDDLRAGIVTTDMGVGDNPGVIGCPSATGDEGIFVSESRSEAAECAGFALEEPSWLQFDGTNGEAFESEFACLAELGTNGCGLEQQLEASREALTTHREAGGPHEGFLRSDSLVAVIFVTDEDDCSAADESIFDPSPAATSELGPLGTRCAFHPELLHPTDRYVRTLKDLALDRRGDVIVAAITGVPRALTEDPLDVDFEALLADERMEYREDETRPGQLAPACEFGGVGRAPPARRLVEVVREFAETGDGLLASICEPDMRPAIASIAELVAARLCDAPE
ncbi:MAG TPA: hypothetical protein RMH85_06445 [Polyangiaceae bacterium LLY-WYZ-15_(1-7)]|nr:hypothetical protein [Myxococcales bacterium]MAT26902.1 hypothetical protein [Sandaracinus sp.]HJK93390.1 hypothetical protein [Polyangiaceae bacterium LLY-WYZ-15_(1-7)]MBJ70215.1 hypothetical protein [Sandaracinus sp.]HJL03105.1 hypothetical protein [Polyangiaceae bacterium LLY-WYZ-15_(1-7)]